MGITSSREKRTTGFVAIAGALHRELLYIFPEIKIERKVARDGFRFWIGSHGIQKILLVQTGVGPDQARHAARMTLSAFPVENLISVGFACALNDRMKIGDLVVGERVSFLDSEARNNQVNPACPAPARPAGGGRPAAAGRSYASDQRLLCLAGEAFQDLTLFKGPLLTASRMIEKGEEKKRIARLTGAIALDMESAAVADAAAGAKVAYLPIRVISDLADEDLIGVSAFFSSEGRPRLFRGILHLLLHPHGMTHLNRLRIHTIAASKRLGGFIHDYLHHLN